ncbi:hypothetical protein LWI29_021743 [Acer saccharum]|uniref:Uncharacterized protein n=1 Tax=Acer saccharum TaxID=4024 RepID=A0AA39SMF3_ACESA|nr:hypothetical protein LWI29_021743 [Acer saccharum]
MSWLNRFLDLGSFSPVGGVSDLPGNEQCSSDFDFQNSRMAGVECGRGQLPYTAKKASSNRGLTRNQKGSGGLTQDGPLVVGPGLECVAISSQGNVLGQVHKNISDITILSGGDHMSVDHNRQPNREPNRENIQVVSSLGEHSSSLSGNSNKTGTEAYEDNSSGGLGKMSDSTFLEQDTNEVQLPPKTPKKKGRKKCPAIKSHAMKTRNSSRSNDDTVKRGRSDKCWNLEVEITKVIEKGATLGVNFINLREENEAGWSVPVEEEEIERLRAEWNLEEEITKA